MQTFATTSLHTSKTFNIGADELSNHHISTLLKNQGVYNGLLAVILSFAAISQNLLWSRLLLGYVIQILKLRQFQYDHMSFVTRFYDGRPARSNSILPSYTRSTRRESERR